MEGGRGSGVRTMDVYLAVVHHSLLLYVVEDTAVPSVACGYLVDNNVCAMIRLTCRPPIKTQPTLTRVPLHCVLILRFIYTVRDST